MQKKERGGGGSGLNHVPWYTLLVFNQVTSEMLCSVLKTIKIRYLKELGVFWLYKYVTLVRQGQVIFCIR